MKNTIYGLILSLIIILIYAYFQNTEKNLYQQLFIRQVIENKDEKSEQLQQQKNKLIGKRFVDLNDNQQKTYRFFTSIYPVEIYWGDTVYVEVGVENLNRQVIKVHPSTENKDYFGFDFSVTALSGQENQSVQLYPYEMFYISSYQAGYRVLESTELQPGCQRTLFRFSIELPALENIRDTFWTSLITSENKTLMINVCINKKTPFLAVVSKSMPMFYLCDGAQDFCIPLKIMNRPSSEMKQLESWLGSLSVDSLPTLSNGMTTKHSPRANTITDKQFFSQYKNDPKIKKHANLCSIDCWYLFSHRKPALSNAPTTIQGWRDLESSLVPSTMRDEIQMTRMLLEYYNASGVQQDKKLAEIDAWLESLPSIQSSIMARYSKSPKYTPLYKASQKIKPVIEKFTNTKDRSIPIPVQTYHAKEITE